MRVYTFMHAFGIGFLTVLGNICYLIVMLFHFFWWFLWIFIVKNSRDSQQCAYVLGSSECWNCVMFHFVVVFLCLLLYSLDLYDSSYCCDPNGVCGICEVATLYFRRSYYQWTTFILSCCYRKCWANISTYYVATVIDKFLLVKIKAKHFVHFPFVTSKYAVYPFSGTILNLF